MSWAEAAGSCRVFELLNCKAVKPGPDDFQVLSRKTEDPGPSSNCALQASEAEERLARC